MNKNLMSTNKDKVGDQLNKRVGDGAVKIQNDELNSLLQKHYASQKNKDRSFIVCHYVPKFFRGKSDDKYEYCECKKSWKN